MMTLSPLALTDSVVPMPDHPIYTPEQANELLPWLTERLGELLKLATSLRVAQNNVQTLTGRVRGNGHHDIGSEMSTAEQEAASLMRNVHELLNQITERGIQVRDVAIGLVDFPGERDGAPVWLCWKVGERAVGHWHRSDQGYSSRKPL